MIKGTTSSHVESVDDNGLLLPRLEALLNRRHFLAATGATAIHLGSSALFPNMTAASQSAAKADFTLRIAPVSVELAPGKIMKTIGYNGTVPGPLLRMREGVSTTVDIFNDTDTEELVHWHGLMVSAEVDGAAEEGTPPVPAHGQRRYTFVPKPAGTRWYHTHNIAGTDLTRGMYSGQFGFLYIEPKVSPEIYRAESEPGNYDREVFLAIHQWEPSTAIHMGPPNNGLEVSYQYASFNDKMLGHGDPIRVKTGERVLFRLLNASATDDLRLALPGHQFQVIALDGNPVLTPRSVNILQIGVAERIDAIVEMKQPGVWVLGSISDKDRQQGMGIIVEYADHKGGPQWITPTREPWDYGIFGKTQIPPDADGKFELVFRKVPGERVRFNRWTINGKSFPDTDPLIVRQGRRYRMTFATKAAIPIRCTCTGTVLKSPILPASSREAYPRMSLW